MSRTSSRRKKLFLATATFALLASAPAFAANLYETLKADPQFSTLVKIIDANGVKGSYTGAAQHTVFAPTNAAFAATANGGSDMAAPGDATTRQNTQALLLYQIVPGRLTEESLKGKTQTFTTLQTGKVSVNGTGSVIHFGDQHGADVSGAPIAASNGMIYPLAGLPVPVFTEVDSTRPQSVQEPVPAPVVGTPVPNLPPPPVPADPSPAPLGQPAN